MKAVLDIVKAAGIDIGQAEPWHLSIENKPWMRLVIEGIGEGPDGLPAISVCHYGEQNGDAMRDPEMCFQVAPDCLKMDPYYFRNDYVGVERESRFVRDGRVMVRPGWARDDRNFARTWNRNIREQGFLKAAKKAAAMQSCDYCGKPTADKSALPVCDDCAQKIKGHEYGTCRGDGYPLDARGMCCAPMSVAD